MPVDRPTFSESWYRVAELSPRLRSTIQVHRQHYRGQTWYVLQDPTSNQFSRLNEAGYYFLGLLEGRRSVGEVWHACNEMLGDAAPTQGEAIQLLGQLYTANLLQAELPPDAEGLFERYRKRRTRDCGAQGFSANKPNARLDDRKARHSGVSGIDRSVEVPSGTCRSRRFFAAQSPDGCIANFYSAFRDRVFQLWLRRIRACPEMD